MNFFRILVSFWSISLCAEIPTIFLESLDFSNCVILRTFDPYKHLPEANYKEHSEYFIHRNRTVYLSEDQRFAIKVWEEKYPSAQNFLKASRMNFYEGIAKLEGVIFDHKGNCRGYITPYMISRDFHRLDWEKSGFVLEKNAFGVKIFAPYVTQPENYKSFFSRILQKVQETGFLSTDFCPNNVVLDPKSNEMYLVDLEDVLEINSIDMNDPTTQMLLEYNPNDYLKSLNLLKSAELNQNMVSDYHKTH